MANEITVSSDFAVSRTSKAGRTTYRGALGVITSGNSTERGVLAGSIIEQLVANNNYRHLMREVCRVFPTSMLKKSPLVVFDTANKEIYIRVDATTLERFDQYNPNKAMAHMYAAEVLRLTGGTELKGEKKMYAAALAKMLDAESARLAAAISEEYARLENEAAADAETNEESAV